MQPEMIFIFLKENEDEQEIKVEIMVYGKIGKKKALGRNKTNKR